MAKTSNPRAAREREAERQRTQEEARRQAYQKAVRRRRFIGIGVLAAVALATIGTVAVAASSKNKTATTSTSVKANIDVNNPSTTVNTAVPVSLPKPEAGATLTEPTTCPATDGSATRTTKFAAAPPMCIDTKKDYTAKVHTSKGDLVVSLLPTAAPNAVNNFVTLARYHYYDGLPVTRIMQRGWAEVGDPTLADGTKAPGYAIPGETGAQGSIATPLIFATLPDASGNSGGGFIFGIADQAPGMPRNATQIGNILDSRVDPTKPPEGQSTVQHLIDQAATTSGAPAEVITIKGIDIEETVAK